MLVWQLPQGAAMSPPMTFVLVSSAYFCYRKMGQRRLLQFLGERKLSVLTRGEKKMVSGANLWFYCSTLLKNVKRGRVYS